MTNEGDLDMTTVTLTRMQARAAYSAMLEALDANTMLCELDEDVMDLRDEISGVMCSLESEAITDEGVAERIRQLPMFLDRFDAIEWPDRETS